MNTCLIYGHSGLDLDVTMNLVAFYRRYGFVVMFSNKLYDANLLVVIRGVDRLIDFPNYSYDLVHVYDYGGWDFDALLRSLPKEISYVFCTSAEKAYRIGQLGFPFENIFLALPPVEICLWKKKIKKVKQFAVHIGNYKPIDASDGMKVRFNNALNRLDVNIWGLNWQVVIDKSRYHGKIGLFNVSDVYASSVFGLGLMYPFQRNVTFSGRFWQAPLNGCHVFSEPGLYTAEMPGIVETDYSVDDLESKFAGIIDRQALQVAAVDYWKSQHEKTSRYVNSTLRKIKVRKFSIGYLIMVFILRRLNQLRILYQKLEVFKWLS
jgi:hypothetical protein